MLTPTNNILQYRENFSVILKFISLSFVILFTPQRSHAQDISSRSISKAEEHFNLGDLEDLLYSNGDILDNLFDCRDITLFEQTSNHMRYVCTSNSAPTRLIEFTSNFSSVMLCLPSAPSDGRYFKDNAYETIAASTSQGETVGTQYFMGYYDGWTRNYVNIYSELNISGWGRAACWSLLSR